jgi:hypothetical protein
MTTQEDLAALFSRNLSLQNTYVAPTEEPSQVEAPIVYSISQHYHHSAHLASQQPSRPASEPPQTHQYATEIILSRHGVDVNSLSPSQLDLFKTADASQQMRLVELWRISPPGYGGHALTHDFVNMPVTNFAQEEAMAMLRYERQMNESRAVGDQHAMDSESTMSDESAANPMPMTPIQGGDGRWNSPEPYMASGYENFAPRDYERSGGPSKDIYSHFGTAIGGPMYNQATDPVYNNSPDAHKYSNVGGDWTQLMEQRRQAMENQYGAFTQFQHSGGATVTGQYSGQDEEML